MKAAFLDRDGVINVDRAYVHRWEDFEFVPGALDALARLQAVGWRLVVVTNQAGIARGYYDEAQFRALTARMVEAMAAHGIAPPAVYHCPHHPAGKVAPFAVDCDCRKPAPGMILRAAAELGLALADSVLVGDKPSDIAAARAAGVGRAFLVRSDNEESSGAADGAEAVFDSLAECVDALLAADGAAASSGGGLHPCP